MSRDFKNIKAWKYADELTLAVYAHTKNFPKEETYGLKSQIRRAAVSVPANIAEGAGRKHKREYLNFLYIAKSSLAETEYMLHLSNRIGYLADADYRRLEDMREETAKTLQGLINAVTDDMSDSG